MFTFKRQKQETGLAGIARPYPNVIIKLKGKVVGWIAAPTAFSSSDYKVYFHVVNDGDGSTCPFKNIRLKARFETELTARDHINRNFEKITTGLKLYNMDED